MVGTGPFPHPHPLQEADWLPVISEETQRVFPKVDHLQQTARHLPNLLNEALDSRAQEFAFE